LSYSNYATIIVQIKSEMEAGTFKPNCALVILNFMIRHGIITPDSGWKYYTTFKLCLFPGHSHLQCLPYAN